MKHTLPFFPADILLPKTNPSAFAVIACDQFTSQPDYWAQAEQIVGDAPSALRITFPEIFLSDRPDERIACINRTMEQYLVQDIFSVHENTLIYVERTLPDGSVRHGLVGKIDLEAYDFQKGSSSLIRATEGTVLERIPPRVAIRKNAPLELPHVMLLIDDAKQTVIEPLASASLPLAYDFDLMLGGGHLKGYFVQGSQQAQVLTHLQALLGEEESPLLFAVGDGNHSLATAKTCYEQNPCPENRYALVELVNIHDSALQFEPIYRVVFDVDTADLTKALCDYANSLCGKATAQAITLCTKDSEITVNVAHPVEALPVGTLQTFLDSYLKAHPKASIDYIHGSDVTRDLAKRDNTVGFLFEGMKKSELFSAVCADGALPRKTFSMGEAASKRYYMEARRIQKTKE